MKDSKKQKGTKVMLTKGKRVSLRCPLSIDRTDLEYNYDAGIAQVCLTIENMGGGGISDDSVESAIIVTRLFDAQGNPLPCTKNDYFAKLIRFGEEGLQSGAQITLRFTPDCDGGLRAADLELYVSRVRYLDGTVTDYLRGDFFDLPGDPIPLQKKHKKHMAAITARFGNSARYEPEALTEIIWRCTCGEFCESDECATCGNSKNELFDYFKPTVKPTAIPLPLESTSHSASESTSSPIGQAASADSALPNDVANAPATDATTEYDTGTFVAGVLGAKDNYNTSAKEASDKEEEPAPHEFRAAPPAKKPDKLKIGLISAIVASGIVLIIIVTLLILAVASRGKQPTDTVSTTTTSTVETKPPISTDSPEVTNEKIVRAYLEQKSFDNALGYARMTGCSEALIREVLTAAVDYYTNTEPNIDKAMQYAQELGDSASIESLTLQRYNKAMSDGDYTAAIGYAEQLTEDKDAKLSAAAEGLLQSQLAEHNFDAALQTAQTYQTATKAIDITHAAITYHTGKQDFDKAIELAESISDSEQIAAIAKTAVDHYVSEQNYDRAADYVRLTGNNDDIVELLPHFTEPAIKMHLPTFFPFLSFEDKQAVHASVMSADGVAGIVDVYGNAHWGADQSHLASESGKTVVSIKSNKLTTVLLFSDGTVAAFGNNAYGQCNVTEWHNIVAIDASEHHTVGLRADGTVVAAGRNDQGQCEVSEFTDAVAIAAGGYHTLILFNDGSVKAIGMSSSGQCKTSGWKDIVAISAGNLHSVGLRSDGSAIAAGSSTGGRCDVDEWRNVIQISAGESATVGLTSDGKLLLASADTNSGDISQMTDVIWVSAGSNSVTALCSNGTLVTTGNTPPDLTFVSTQTVVTDVYGVQ